MFSLSFARRLAVMLACVCAVAPALAHANILEVEGTVLGIQQRPFIKDTRKGRVTVTQSTVLVWFKDVYGVGGQVSSVEMEPGLQPGVQEGDVVCVAFDGVLRIVSDDICASETSAGGIS